MNILKIPNYSETHRKWTTSHCYSLILNNIQQFFKERGSTIPKSSVEWVIEEANRSCSVAQNMLAYMFDYGYGVSQHHEKAFELYQRSADQGNTVAQINVA
ncbi:MAG: hypothetical protein Harvfovirus32_17 [Harvfovirus sp.]|uniref:Sel1 repeat family protein n=1 Tax=Harvfovirus sp. TaxID=2487768 RepID=A0A3G5A5B2_9VIRU|nr:MAG: hypothetical protein Harvfovirus32_17 [Harvfovirus sp.]